MKVVLIKEQLRETKSNLPIGFVLEVTNEKGKEMIKNGLAKAARAGDIQAFNKGEHLSKGKDTPTKGSKKEK